MRHVLALLVGIAIGICTVLFALTLLGLEAMRRHPDINDAPCLVCQAHRCICGE